MEVDVILIAFSLLALLVLGVGAVFLFFWSGGWGRRILGGIVVGVFMVGVALAAVYRFAEARDVRRAPAVVAYGQADAGVDPRTAEVRLTSQYFGWSEMAGWPVESDPQFKPDVYPSQATAGRALAREIADALPTLVGDGPPAEVIWLTGNADRWVIDAAAEALTKRSPTTKVVTLPRSATVVEGSRPTPGRASQEIDQKRTVHVQLDVSLQATGREEGDQQSFTDEGGTLRVQAAGPTGRLHRTVRFLDKPWVDNLYLSKSVLRDQRRQRVVAHSTRPCTDPAEAEAQALENAVRCLAPKVRHRLREELAKDRFLRAVGQDDADTAIASESILTTIRAELLTSRLVTDRFVQSFDRPYGRVWRQAILIDISPHRFEQLVLACERSIQARQASWRNTALSIGALFVLICVVYGFLNAATKGYFTWSLRVAALGTVVLGVVVLLFVA